MLGPCRLPYELLSNDTKNKNDVLGNVSNVSNILDKGYLLSTRDLCSLEFLPKLIDSGVMCFKIEGRMKTPEYVATVTRIYRKYIDLALSDKPYNIAQKDIEDLAQVFNRGSFSSGHLSSKANRNLVFSEKPNHMGIYVGNVSNLKQNKSHVLVNLTNSLSLGDSIQFEKETSKYTVSELMLKGKNVQTVSQKQLVEIGRMKGNLHIGDKIYKISSKELSNFAKLSYQEEHKKIPLKGHITLKKNRPIVLEICTIKNNNPLFENVKVSLSSNEFPIEAKSKPIDRERIIYQLSKTNDTIFTFDTIDIELEDNLFLPSIKVLNELRRNALEKINLIAIKRILRESPNISKIHLEENIKITKTKKEISVLLNNLNENENYENLKNIDKIYIPLKYFSSKKYQNIIKTISNKFDTYIYLPTIVKGNYKNLLDYVIAHSINNYYIKGFVISNLANGIFIKKIKEKYQNRFKFIGNYTLNIYNTHSINEWKNLGINTLTISPELDFETIKNITDNSSIEQELIVYGRCPLMSMNYCLLGKTNKCYPTCKAPCKENKEYYLKDRLGFIFPVIPDNIQTVSTIYNSKITSIDSSLFNVSSYRIDILDEKVEQINDIAQTVLLGKRLEGKEYTNGNLSTIRGNP